MLESLLSFTLLVILIPAMSHFLLTCFHSLKKIEATLHSLNQMDQLLDYSEQLANQAQSITINPQGALTFNLASHRITLDHYKERIRLKYGKVTRYLSDETFDCKALSIHTVTSKYFELTWQCNTLTAKQILP